MTPEELIIIVRTSAGEPEDGALGPGRLDVAFGDLGYDSVQVLEIAGQIERQLGVALPDEVLGEGMSLGALLELVNETAARPVS